MSVAIDVTDHVDITFSGIDKVVTLANQAILDAGEIVEASVQPVSQPRSQLGWRLAGTYVPGVLAAGWYTVNGQRAKRQLWSVYRDSDVLVIETTRSSPSRIVLQHPDRAMLADRINAIRRR